jgi:hypothetical protein
MTKKNNNSQLIALTVLYTFTPRRLLLTSFITTPAYGLKELEEERKRAQKWLESISNKVQEIEKTSNTKQRSLKVQYQ